MAEQAPAIDYLDELKTYEVAGAAAHLSEEKSRLGLVPQLMLELYRKLYKDADKDQIIQGAIGRASRGAQAGHLSDPDFLEALQYYAGRHQEALEKAKISVLIEYLDGIKPLPKGIKSYLGNYADKKLSEIPKDEQRLIKDMIVGQRVNFAFERRAVKGLEGIIDSNDKTIEEKLSQPRP